MKYLVAYTFLISCASKKVGEKVFAKVNNIKVGSKLMECQKQKDEDTLLMKAVKNRDMVGVQLLMNHGMKVKSIEVLEASRRGYLDIVEELFKDEDVKIYNSMGHISFLAAIWWGHYEVVEFFLEREVDPSGELLKQSMNQHEVLKILEMIDICEGTDEYEYFKKETPLSLANIRGEGSISKLLRKYMEY